MKCEGFGSVQALWLGRLRYKEHWQQAVDGKKRKENMFHILQTKPQTSHTALTENALSAEEPHQEHSLSVLYQVQKKWLLIVLQFFLLLCAVVF